MLNIIVAIIISILGTFALTSAGWMRFHKRVVKELISEAHADASKSFEAGWNGARTWIFHLTVTEFEAQKKIYHNR